MTKQFKEFQHIAIPAFLDTPEWKDTSWGNDITAQMTLIRPNDPYELIVWVYEPNPADREYPECPRYAVSVYDSATGDLIETTDAQTDADAIGAIIAARETMDILAANLANYQKRTK